MDGYTFDEGVSVLRLLGAPDGMIRHIVSTHNRSHLHSEIHKMLRIPGTMRMVKGKGYNFVETPAPESDNAIAGSDSNENVSENDQTGTEPRDNEPEKEDLDAEPADSGPASDDTEIIITMEDVRSHKHTRLEDMPNDLTRNLWLKKQDYYREMQQNHLKMRSVPEGEEHNEERAKYRSEVLRLNEEIKKTWELIDAEIERFNSENEAAERADNGAKENEEASTGFNVSTYRSYISRAVRKKELTDAQKKELQRRVDAMLAAKEELSQETLSGLKAIGIKLHN